MSRATQDPPSQNRLDSSIARGSTSRDFERRGFRPRRLVGYSSLGVLGLALTVLIQATLLSRIRVLGACPNLLLVTTIAWGLLQGFSEGVVWAFAGGLALDLITGMPLGTSSLAGMTACLLTRLGRNRVFASNLWWPLLLVAMATPVYGWIVLLTEQFRGVPVDWLGSTMHVVGPELALNVASMALVYPLLRAATAKGIR